MEQNKAPVVSRETYRRIKGMDRAEISAYIANVYVKGFEAGQKANAPDILIKAFRELLISVDSIGPARAEAIMRKFAEQFKTKSDGTPQEKQSGEQENGEKEGAGDESTND